MNTFSRFLTRLDAIASIHTTCPFLNDNQLFAEAGIREMSTERFLNFLLLVDLEGLPRLLLAIGSLNFPRIRPFLDLSKLFFALEVMIASRNRLQKPVILPPPDQALNHKNRVHLGHTMCGAKLSI